jgi:hypothetical protein
LFPETGRRDYFGMKGTRVFTLREGVGGGGVKPATWTVSRDFYNKVVPRNRKERLLPKGRGQRFLH